MKILFDYQAFELQRFGGISRYFYELIKSCQTQLGCDFMLPIKYSNNEYLKKLPRFTDSINPLPDYYNDFLYGLNFKGKWSLYNLHNKLFPQQDLSTYNKRLSIETLMKGEFDLLHPTYFDDYFLKYLSNKPYVLTIYDMIHERYPQFYQNNLVRSKKRVLAKAASKIIAISEHTKRDIMDIYNIDEHKIEVIYLGSSITENILDNTTEETLPENFLLYVGGRTIYKNFFPFLKAILPLFYSNKDLSLVCTGERFTEAEKSIFEEYRLLDRVIHFAANDDLLAKLYKKAIAFVFPSLYEGFGLPVLEAFSCGCPVVLSNTSSLPEVGGNAALYFDPTNISSIHEVLEQVVRNTELKKQMITKGFEQLKKFSWSSTREQTVALYKKII